MDLSTSVKGLQDRYNKVKEEAKRTAANALTDTNKALFQAAANSPLFKAARQGIDMLPQPVKQVGANMYNQAMQNLPIAVAGNTHQLTNVFLREPQNRQPLTEKQINPKAKKIIGDAAKFAEADRVAGTGYLPNSKLVSPIDGNSNGRGHYYGTVVNDMTPTDVVNTLTGKDENAGIRNYLGNFTTKDGVAYDIHDYLYNPNDNFLTYLVRNGIQRPLTEIYPQETVINLKQ